MRYYTLIICLAVIICQGCNKPGLQQLGNTHVFALLPVEYKLISNLNYGDRFEVQFLADKNKGIRVIEDYNCSFATIKVAEDAKKSISNLKDCKISGYSGQMYESNGLSNMENIFLIFGNDTFCVTVSTQYKNGDNDTRIKQQAILNSVSYRKE